MLHQQRTLNCGGKLISLEDPLIMGILNLDPASFYKQSTITSESDLIKRVYQMLKDGMDILDVGAMSSRPGSIEISIDEERERLIPSIRALVKEFPDLIISIDTYRSGVMKPAADEGARMINDITAFKVDSSLPSLAVSYQLPYILMHMQGMPFSMQKNPVYNNVSLEVLDFFIKKVAKLRAEKVLDIIIDPGFGFGKSVEDNYHLLNDLHTFRMLELPIMVGVSRKSMINKVLNVRPEFALNGTSALHMVALLQGANLLRVHDVKEAKECVLIYKQLKHSNYENS